MSDQQKSVRILPWTGDDYTKQGPVFRKRTLILGGSQYSPGYESFHEEGGHEEWKGFTNEVVEYYLDPNIAGTWKKTYSTFINSVSGHPTNEEERRCFFDSIIFYNYLQEIAGASSNEAGNFDYNAPEYFSAFLEILVEHRPEVVISWGSKVWNALPNDWGYGPATVNEEIMIGSKKFASSYLYPYKDTNILLVGVNHPSIGYDVGFHYELFKCLKLLSAPASVSQ